ncbi:uncharacterized protein MONOS_17180 [Monocercomonoides exilis]|uniref:uncharacterized protein n=1 Tax=Monocercomonoides exilis TaxID=2049356 RepID=UPI00355979AC|nr:hypothetical protein MONOS_17179 [Monocercomonoides exilis]KAH7828454.1 hypothetical protein MONOS_17180 [Monocercomonoides exilis]
MNELFEEENEGMFDKAAELGLNVQRDFCVSEEEWAAGGDGARGLSGEPTRTEGADNWVWSKGEKGGVANVEEAVMF